jgi:hypothetical protein
MLGTASYAGGRNDPAALTPIAVPINYETDAGKPAPVLAMVYTAIGLFRTFVQQYGHGHGQKEGFEMMPDMELPKERAALAADMPKYLEMLQEVANLQRTAITIELDDLIEVDLCPVPCRLICN